MPHALRSHPFRAAGHLAGTLGRRAARRRGRLAWLGVVLLAAAALRGPLGVALAILALMLVVDAMVPLPGESWSEADDRFWRLVRARRREERRRRRRGLPPARLDVLDDRGGWASVAERRSLGVVPIALDSITGTVEGAKAGLFDARLRPDPSAAQRWKGLWMAQAHGASLPPISVYRVGTAHVLRDGHHRVSVALEHGAPVIDAEVVELRRHGAGAPARALEA